MGKAGSSVLVQRHDYTQIPVRVNSNETYHYKTVLPVMENHKIEGASPLLHIVAYETFRGKSKQGKDRAVSSVGGAELRGHPWSVASHTTP